MVNPDNYGTHRQQRLADEENRVVCPLRSCRTEFDRMENRRFRWYGFRWELDRHLREHHPEVRKRMLEVAQQRTPLWRHLPLAQ